MAVSDLSFLFPFWPISVPPYCDYNWLVGVQSQNRVYRETRLYPKMIFLLLLCSSISLVPCYSASSLPRYSSPFSSSYASDTALYLSRSRTSYSHHLFATHLPLICTLSLQRSRIGRIIMYCATVFWLFGTYSSISSNPASCISILSRGYSYLSLNSRRVWILVIFQEILCWDPPRARTMWGPSTTSLPKKSEPPTSPP